MQPLLLQLLKLCHAGLNYGGGQSVEDSGEIDAQRFVFAKLGNSRALTIFDVGANDGAYLQSALNVFRGRLKAYSFEPQSATFNKLRTRFENEPRVELRKVAIGKESGTAELFFDGDFETTASLHRNPILGQVHSETVQVTTIDQICKEDAIERIDLLKIDTEGHEMDVLLGASATIESGRIEAVQFEFGDTSLHTPHHFYDFWQLLSSRYTFYRILRKGVVEIPRYSPDLEIYKIANFLCMRK